MIPFQNRIYRNEFAITKLDEISDGFIFIASSSAFGSPSENLINAITDYRKEDVSDGYLVQVI
ncbi:hypothetical protein [Klebsiella oxytoca]|uniref:Uncharacterized protein n=1 Tax=Klebsiella oxytoca TaxID=571 RepID=A0A6B8MXN3_KLEOX|nr:hypothetical protein [Klebsiella oxytoca]QGN37808.1 hypothetical protein GJ746_11050 [Klebsiella oxytoca]